MSNVDQSPFWDPAQYARYSDYRGRAFFELVDRVRAVEPRTVVDLGCGAGELTASLADRWPGAHVVGIDSSAEMLAKAAAASRTDVEFSLGDLASWQPEEPVDVLVSNAALQWVPAHLDLLPRLASWLRPGGWLAFQVPGNFDQPSHTILADLGNSRPWSERLGGHAVRHGSHEPSDYLSVLAGAGLLVDAWETTYLHVLTGEDPILEWTRGTALRPVLSKLTAADAAEFEAEYAKRLRAAYPWRPFGTVFPFRRIFVVAQLPPKPRNSAS